MSAADDELDAELAAGETTPQPQQRTCQVLRAAEEAGVTTYRVMIMANKERACQPLHPILLSQSCSLMPDDDSSRAAERTGDEMRSQQ